MIQLWVHPNPFQPKPKYWAYEEISGDLYYDSCSNWNSLRPKGKDDVPKLQRTAREKKRKGYLLLSDRIGSTHELRELLGVISGNVAPNTPAQLTYLRRWNELRFGNETQSAPPVKKEIINPLVLPAQVEGSLCYW